MSRRISADLMLRVYGRNVEENGYQMTATDENLPDALCVITEVAEAFDALGIAYLVGGSVASSPLGNFRATQDFGQVLAELQSSQARPLANRLGEDYYADANTMRQAIATRKEMRAVSACRYSARTRNRCM
ncbi:MAG: hypothetical protein H7Y38_15670 [Armatimonadetes bacterium]|nr:hypothetical protein [Armatimonadota bacterium]